MNRAVVIGGGISGLAAAHRLSRDGVEVTVIEATAVVGGKLRVSDVAGLPVDEGAETFLRRVPEALDLIHAVGLGDQLVAPAQSGASVWARGQLRPLPPRTVLGLPTDPATLRGILTPPEIARVRLDRVLPGQPPIDDVAVGAWVGRRLGRAVVERLVDPLLGGVYAGRADELSLAATLPQLPRDERSALAAAERALVPASPDAGPVFGALTSGLGVLPGAVATATERLGGRIVTGRTVRRLERTPTCWRVVHGPTTHEQAVEADAVIIAVPAVAAGRLLTEVAPVAAAELTAIDAASMAIVTTAWRAADVPELNGTGYLVPAVYRRPVKAVTFSSVKWPHLQQPDVVVTRCSLGRYGDVADLQRDDDDLVAVASAELTDQIGFQGKPIEARVTRWGGGLPQYVVGHKDRVERIRAAVSGLPGLVVCGASYDGVGVPACIRTGLQAAEHVLTGFRSREAP
jgi:oxygen-dependent protoporphyrinogen oxidase